MSWLKALAPMNILSIVVTAPTFQRLMSALNSVASRNNSDISVTRETSQFDMRPNFEDSHSPSTGLLSRHRSTTSLMFSSVTTLLFSLQRNGGPSGMVSTVVTSDSRAKCFNHLNAPSNIRTLVVNEFVVHRIGLSFANETAFRNISSIVDTLFGSHCDKLPSNVLALSNMFAIVVTARTSHVDTSICFTFDSSNIPFIFVA
mmetsp:Transcript_3489/g.11843  ORF Transcript_3489/g.11843 Transcript_3489/m.11843 type:complete len:202 (+) Transcript_3489:1850-2455(+)